MVIWWYELLVNKKVNTINPTTIVVAKDKSLSPLLHSGIESCNGAGDNDRYIRITCFVSVLPSSAEAQLQLYWAEA